MLEPLIIGLASRASEGVLLPDLAQLLLPLVQLVAGDTEFHRQVRCRLLPEFEQPNGFQFEFLAEPHTFALRIDLADCLSHSTPPKILSTFKCVRKSRSTSGSN
jgi:hypothetical protein